MEKESISSKYDLLQKELKGNSGKLTFEQFQKIHKDFINLSDLIENADLFSDNENIEEISTSSLKYLLIPFEHGKFIDSNAVSSQLGLNADPIKRNKLRLIVIKIVESMIWKFVSMVVLNLKIDEYKDNQLNNEDFKKIYKWILTYSDLRQSEISNNGNQGFVKLNELEKINFQNGGPMARREMKISKFQLEKELNNKIKILDNKEIFDKLDEEVVRKVRIDQILLAILDSIGILENLSMEREMLSNIVGNSGDDLQQLKIEGMQLLDDDNDNSDSRKKNKSFDKGYTDKVENINANNNPILSKEGKVLRPFTIVGSDLQRKELQKKVTGTGQVLPTMTVEELVDQELKNGGMVKPKEEEPEIDEDDYEWQDKETHRLREWDEFTDSHKKGSGNKMGNLG